MERLSRHRSGAKTGPGVSRAMAVCLVLCIALLLARTPVAQTTPADPACDIHLSAEGRMMRLEAVFHGAKPASGEFRLVVRKQGVSGTSQTIQQGRFTARPDGGQKALGSVMVGLSAGDALSAELTVQTGDTLICSATL